MRGHVRKAIPDCNAVPMYIDSSMQYERYSPLSAVHVMVSGSILKNASRLLLLKSVSDENGSPTPGLTDFVRNPLIICFFPEFGIASKINYLRKVKHFND